jgi:hypothetical protein
MKRVTFGISQFGQPTPEHLKKYYRLILLATSIWVMALEPQLPFLSEHVRYVVTTSLAVTGSVTYYVLQFFGVTDVPPPGTGATNLPPNQQQS